MVGGFAEDHVLQAGEDDRAPVLAVRRGAGVDLDAEVLLIIIVAQARAVLAPGPAVVVLVQQRRDQLGERVCGGVPEAEEGLARPEADT